jgi:dolichol-phosphate mannosyltransferase
MKPTVSVIIPALNEEENLGPTVETVLAALDRRFDGYEVLIFNDGSTDNTRKMADRLALRGPNIKVVHNGRNMGVGYNYQKGIALARNEYIVMFPGDNQMLESAMVALFDQIGKADLIVPYTANDWVRPLSRRIISRAFVLTMNLLFGLRLRYYTGTVVHRREALQKVPLSATGFAAQPEAVVRLIRAGHSYLEVGVDIQERPFGTTKMFAWENIVNVFKTVGRLFWDVRIRQRKRYGRPVREVIP